MATFADRAKLTGKFEGLFERHNPKKGVQGHVFWVKDTELPHTLGHAMAGHQVGDLDPAGYEVEYLGPEGDDETRSKAARLDNEQRGLPVDEPQPEAPDDGEDGEDDPQPKKSKGAKK